MDSRVANANPPVSGAVGRPGGHAAGSRYAPNVTDRAERAERVQLLTEMARTLVASGADLDQVAKGLLQYTDSPILAIKAFADATGTGLGDAKWVVHRNLGPGTREAAERLWADLLDGVKQLREESPGSPDSVG